MNKKLKEEIRINMKKTDTISTEIYDIHQRILEDKKENQLLIISDTSSAKITMPKVMKK